MVGATGASRSLRAADAVRGIPRTISGRTSSSGRNAACGAARQVRRGKRGIGARCRAACHQRPDIPAPMRFAMRIARIMRHESRHASACFLARNPPQPSLPRPLPAQPDGRHRRKLPRTQKAASRGSGSYAHAHDRRTTGARRPSEAPKRPPQRAASYFEAISHFPTLALPRSGSKGQRQSRLISARKGAPSGFALDYTGLDCVCQQIQRPLAAVPRKPPTNRGNGGRAENG